MIVEKGSKGLIESSYSRIAIQILIAMQFMKANEVIHGDLKPDNVLLKERGKTGCKIIDFGGASQGSEVPELIVRSMGYTSPESLLHYRRTDAVDMWAFGCILFEMKYGRKLFLG